MINSARSCAITGSPGVHSKASAGTSWRRDTTAYHVRRCNCSRLSLESGFDIWGNKSRWEAHWSIVDWSTAWLIECQHSCESLNQNIENALPCSTMWALCMCVASFNETQHDAGWQTNTRSLRPHFKLTKSTGCNRVLRSLWSGTTTTSTLSLGALLCRGISRIPCWWAAILCTATRMSLLYFDSHLVGLLPSFQPAQVRWSTV